MNENNLDGSKPMEDELFERMGDSSLRNHEDRYSD
jgi:hypothetical protein